MLMQKARQEVVEYGKKMSAAGLTNGTSGNISVYDADLGYMAISPSGIGYFDTKAEDVVVMDLAGNIIDGDKRPSSEYDLHANIYKKHSAMRAVVHTHSKYCTTFACMGEPIRAVHYLIAGAEESIVPVVPYATYGSSELAQNIYQTEAEGLALLLSNHGMVAYGPTLAKAFNVAENVEWVAEIQYRTMCIGKPNILSDQEIKRVIDKFKNYGQSDAGADKKSGY